MCLLLSNATADEGFAELPAKDRNSSEKRLANLAETDSRTAENGLGKVLNTVDDWAKDPVLSQVKKYRIGRHRFYLTGRHTECRYFVRCVMPFKKEADDTPQKKVFKERVLKALSQPTTRTILPP